MIYKIGNDLYVLGFQRSPGSAPTGTVVHHQEFDVGLARSLQTVLMETEPDDFRPQSFPPGWFLEPLARASGIASWDEFKEAGGASVDVRSTRETIRLMPPGTYEGIRNTPTIYSTMDGRECLAAIIDAFSEAS